MLGFQELQQLMEEEDNFKAQASRKSKKWLGPYLVQGRLAAPRRPENQCQASGHEEPGDPVKHRDDLVGPREHCISEPPQERPLKAAGNSDSAVDLGPDAGSVDDVLELDNLEELGSCVLNT
jgi:hypothetical protein